MGATVNQNQVQQILQILLAAGGPVAGLLVNWGVPSGQINNYLTILMMLLPPAISAVWALITHSHAAIATAASQIPGVVVSVDSQKAAASLIGVAKDPTNLVQLTK